MFNVRDSRRNTDFLNNSLTMQFIDCSNALWYGSVGYTDEWPMIVITSWGKFAPVC